MNAHLLDHLHRLLCEPDLRHLLRGAESVLKRQLRHSGSLAAFVQGLPVGVFFASLSLLLEIDDWAVLLRVSW